MSATVSIQKLRCIGNLSSPSLPAAELAGSRWPPEHGGKSTRHGANEEPLMPSEVARSRHQSYLLHEAAHRYSKPGIWISHVCANDAARNLSLTGITPRYTPRTDVGPEFDETLSGELVQVELQAVLQAGSGSRTRHRNLTQPSSALIVADSLQKV